VIIRFTSSLTPDDENVIAPALVKAISGILDLVPIAYNLRIETSDSQTYQHTGPSSSSTLPIAARTSSDRLPAI
jgi:hypothetical protein